MKSSKHLLPFCFLDLILVHSVPNNSYIFIMAKSIKANYLFNLINSASQLLFPLITFPYASRIMMADGIGQVNFFQSIISYISLFTCLGIPMYAIREVAKVRDNPEK